LINDIYAILDKIDSYYYCSFCQINTCRLIGWYNNICIMVLDTESG